jgi:transcriptional regulator
MSKKFIPTQNQIDTIITMRGQGCSGANIAITVGISYDALYKIVNEYGLTRFRAARTTSNSAADVSSKVAQILALHHAGMSCADIAATLVISASPIYRILHENGIILEKNERVSVSVEQQIIVLRQSGKGPSQIGRELNMSRNTVKLILVRNGLTKKLLPPLQYKPQPVSKICKDCPENGPQPIANFGTHIAKNGRVGIFSRCKPCYTVYGAKKALALYHRKHKHDPVFRLRASVSRAIHAALFLQGSSKQGHSCFDYLPYTPAELKFYIESLFEPWMNWDNYGQFRVKDWNDHDQSTWRWNLDHIIPQADLLYSSMEEANFQLCWALSNLRPYSAKQNVIDGTSGIRHIAA